MAKLLTTSYQKIASTDWTVVINGTTCYLGLREYAKYTNQDTSTKKTTVKYKSTFVVTSPTISVSVSSGTAKLDGTSKSYGSTTFSRGETTLQEFEKTITHNDDGSSPTKTLTASWSATVTGSKSISGDFTVPKMDLYPSITNSSDISDETSTINLTTTYAEAYQDMTLTFAIFDANDRSHISDGVATPIVAYKSVSFASNGVINVSLTSSDNTALANSVTSGTSKMITLALKSVSGTKTNYSLYDKNMSLVNALPSFGTITPTETNTKVSTMVGSTSASSVVKNASIISLSVSVSGLKGATINSVTATHNGNPYTTTSQSSPYVFTIPIGDFTGANATITLTATDSRGNSSPTTKTIPAIDYTPVSIDTNSIAIKRKNTTSDIVTITLTGNYLNSIGSYANASSAVVTWTSSAGASGTLTNETDYSISNNVLSISGVEVDSNILYSDAGTFTINIKDRLTEVGQSVQIPTGVPLFDFGKTNFEINGDLYIAGTDRTDPKNVYDGMIIESGSNTNGSYIKYGNGVMICWKTLEGYANITTAWGNGYCTNSENTIDLGTLPATFYATPVINVVSARRTYSGHAYNHWIATISNVSTTSAGKVSLMRFTSASNVGYTFHITAFGRWKQ